MNFFRLLGLFQKLSAFSKKMEKDGTIKEIAEAIEAIQREAKDPQLQELFAVLRDFFKR